MALETEDPHLPNRLSALPVFLEGEQGPERAHDAFSLADAQRLRLVTLVQTPTALVVIAPTDGLSLVNSSGTHEFPTGHFTVTPTDKNCGQCGSILEAAVKETEHNHVDCSHCGSKTNAATSAAILRSSPLVRQDADSIEPMDSGKRAGDLLPQDPGWFGNFLIAWHLRPEPTSSFEPQVEAALRALDPETPVTLWSLLGRTKEEAGTTIVVMRGDPGKDIQEEQDVDTEDVEGADDQAETELDDGDNVYEGPRLQQELRFSHDFYEQEVALMKIEAGPSAIGMNPIKCIATLNGDGFWSKLMVPVHSVLRGGWELHMENDDTGEFADLGTILNSYLRTPADWYARKIETKSPYGTIVLDFAKPYPDGTVPRWITTLKRYRVAPQPTELFAIIDLTELETEALSNFTFHRI